MELTIRLKRQDEPPPYSLLLSADSSQLLVDRYLSKGDCYLAWLGEELAGEFVLLRTGPDTCEIMNLAVKESFQGQGIAKEMMAFACEKAREQGCSSLEIGTGNSSLNQLALYQKCGFRIEGVERDFFIKHYEEAIYENGIQCRDLLRLRLEL
ncbi:GNAT family N-acetyltransferase [Paenibacillus physcomitrellae]|uniref:N-acetyltransferase YvbK n=1 Tax=Paenibacillus physcomitrellae TaxID=1619311 RepID=A0ABQ1GK86_9BACL|nr:GNAT family N-acetyltransferase [Paenibacillus physcomitrellae]GGA45253.1 putative N-acetyltransferase YvbK [Paenibacillus physcomitrellae]